MKHIAAYGEHQLGTWGDTVDVSDDMEYCCVFFPAGSGTS